MSRKFSISQKFLENKILAYQYGTTRISASLETKSDLTNVDSYP